VIFSSRNHIKTTQEIVLFPPVFCPTIGGRFRLPPAADQNQGELSSQFRVTQERGVWHENNNAQ
jgi:hypothetical protein